MGKPETTEGDRKTFHLNVEVSGCLSACMHCWAQGHPYPPMKLDDVEYVLEEGARFCRAEGLEFLPYPMHDVLMHPDALKLMRLFSSYTDKPIFQSFTTPGPIPARREDWEEILNGVRELGTTTLWLSFHGMNDVHDRIANCEGAFADTITTIERAKSVGLGCGTNLFLSSASAHQIPDILQFFRSVGISEISAEVVNYCAHPRGRAYEALRPELDQLLPHAEALAGATRSYKDFWSNIEQHTEAYYINEALSKQESDLAWPKTDRSLISAFCRTSMDVYSGKGPSNGVCHGNLRSGDAQAAFAKAVDAWPQTWVEVLCPGVHIPSPPHLAREWGNPQGRKVYMDEWNFYERLLDLASGGRNHERTSG